MIAHAHVPAILAAELADEAPGHPLSRCPNCGVPSVYSAECAACVDARLWRSVARTQVGRVVAYLEARGPARAATVAAALGIPRQSAQDALRGAALKGRAVRLPVCLWGAP